MALDLNGMRLGFRIDESAEYITGTGVPGSGTNDSIAQTVPAGTVYQRTGTPELYIKITGGATTADWEKLALDSEVIKKDGSVDFTGDQSMGGFKLTNVATPTAGTDAVNKDYADAIAAGLTVKAPVLVATTANITLSGEQTIDGVLTSSSDVLVKDQTDPTENGIYTTSAGAWVRRADSDGTPTSEIKGGNIVFVDQGTVNSDTLFVLNALGEVAVDVGAQDWIIYSRAESTTASNGITKNGLNFELTDQSGNGVSVASGVISASVDDVTVEVSGGNIQVKADGINDTHIDFGLGANQVSLADLPYDNSTSGLTATDGQAAVDELDGRIDALEAAAPPTQVDDLGNTGGVLTKVTSVLVDEVVAITWHVMLEDTTNGNREYFDVRALHDGSSDGVTDATDVNFNVINELRLGNVAQDDVTVTLSGTGAAQEMELNVEAANTFDVRVIGAEIITL